MAKLNEKKIKYIIRHHLKGKNSKEIAANLRVSDSRVRQIIIRYKKERKIPILKKP